MPILGSKYSLGPTGVTGPTGPIGGYSSSPPDPTKKPDLTQGHIFLILTEKCKQNRWYLPVLTSFQFRTGIYIVGESEDYVTDFEEPSNIVDYIVDVSNGKKSLDEITLGKMADFILGEYALRDILRTSIINSRPEEVRVKDPPCVKLSIDDIGLNIITHFAREAGQFANKLPDTLVADMMIIGSMSRKIPLIMMINSLWRYQHAKYHGELLSEIKKASLEVNRLIPDFYKEFNLPNDNFHDYIRLAKDRVKILLLEDQIRVLEEENRELIHHIQDQPDGDLYMTYFENFKARIRQSNL
jgi:hypothetical protein